MNLTFLEMQSACFLFSLAICLMKFHVRNPKIIWHDIKSRIHTPKPRIFNNGTCLGSNTINKHRLPGHFDNFILLHNQPELSHRCASQHPLRHSIGFKRRAQETTGRSNEFHRSDPTEKSSRRRVHSHPDSCLIIHVCSAETASAVAMDCRNRPGLRILTSTSKTEIKKLASPDIAYSSARFLSSVVRLLLIHK